MFCLYAGFVVEEARKVVLPHHQLKNCSVKRRGRCRRVALSESSQLIECQDFRLVASRTTSASRNMRFVSIVILEHGGLNIDLRTSMTATGLHSDTPRQYYLCIKPRTQVWSCLKSQKTCCLYKAEDEVILLYHCTLAQCLVELLQVQHVDLLKTLRHLRLSHITHSLFTLTLSLVLPQ